MLQIQLPLIFAKLIWHLATQQRFMITNLWKKAVPKVADTVTNQKLDITTSMECMRTVDPTSSIKDNVVLAGLIRELPNSVPDCVNKE